MIKKIWNRLRTYFDYPVQGYLSHTIKHAKEGSIIYIKPGLYKENITLKKNVYIKAQDSNHTDIQR